MEYKNMETKNYSIEKHLESICNSDDDYDVLLAVWRLNKENLSAALKNIASMFPHYSQHDSSHSIKILDNIQRLLGRDRVERLGATDTFLLLMSALTHDLGMYMTYEMIEKEWDKPEMNKLIESYANGSDKQIAAAARLMQNHGSRPSNPAESYRWALEIRNAVTIILAHQMRRGHGDRSAEHLKNSNFFQKYASRFHFELLPTRYLTLIAQVAHLHGTSFNDVMTTLPHRADGFRSDYIHPRFIASMIRLGDLLDIDNNRFNPYAIAMVKEMPESSQAHYDKHQALKHLLISPEGIEADLNCPTEGSYRVAREMFDWLECEVENQCREWSIIAPPDLGGLPPVLHKDKINIYFKGARPRAELRNLRFDISSRRTFEMLKGGAIYQNPGKVFLREIVQNAMDATKLQIWKDMDTHLPFNAPLDPKNLERLISKREEIQFSDDIPANVYNKYPIDLKVEYNKDEQTISVTCEDWGTGISEESLIRMTSQVGASRRADKNYDKTVEKMPYFLQPTASFGLGLQTVFYVADEFIVDTHYPGEPTRRIVFRTSTDGSYCSIDEEDFDFIRDGKSVLHGTTVKIVIDKTHWSRFFELDMADATEILADPDVVEYRIVEEIDNFAKNSFGNIGSIPLRYHSPYGSFESTKEQAEYEYVKEKGDFRLYWKRGQAEYPFMIENKGEFASRIKVDFRQRPTFFSDFDEILLRNIPVDSFYSSFSSCAKIKWDLWCRKADSLVNLSRDGLLPQGESWFKEVQKEIFHLCLQLIYEPLKKRLSQNPQDEFLIHQYCGLCLANWNLPQPFKTDLDLLKDYKIRVSEYPNQVLFIDNHGAEVSAKRVMESNKFVVSTFGYLNKDIINSYSFHEDEILVSNDASEFLPSDYICSEVISLFHDYIHIEMRRLIKKNSENIQWVTDSNYNFKDLELKNEYGSKNDCYYGFSRYEKIIVVKDAPLLGFWQPYHSNCWIYPISKTIKEELPSSRDEVEQYLREESRMEALVPNYIVKLIQKYNALDNKDLKKKEIHDTYIQLILDNKFGVKKEPKRKATRKRISSSSKAKK